MDLNTHKQECEKMISARCFFRHTVVNLLLKYRFKIKLRDNPNSSYPSRLKISLNAEGFADAEAINQNG